MYPWLRVMYAVVQMGSTILRSECMTTRSTVCARAVPDRQESTVLAAMAAASNVVRLDAMEDGMGDSSIGGLRGAFTIAKRGRQRNDRPHTGSGCGGIA